jgi:hypothetical protein
MIYRSSIALEFARVTQRHLFNQYSLLELNSRPTPVFAKRIKKGFVFLVEMVFFDGPNYCFPNEGLRVDFIERKVREITGALRLFSYESPLAKYGLNAPILVKSESMHESARVLAPLIDRAFEHYEQLVLESTRLLLDKPLYGPAIISNAILEYELFGAVKESTLSMLSISNPYASAVRSRFTTIN